MSESDESNMPPFIGLAKPLAYLYENKETGGKIPLIDRIAADDRYIETPLIALSEVPPQKPDWDAASEAMRWLNDIESMQGGRSGPTIKLRAAIEAMAQIREKLKSRKVPLDICNDAINAAVADAYPADRIAALERKRDKARELLKRIYEAHEPWSMEEIGDFLKERP